MIDRAAYYSIRAVRARLLIHVLMVLDIWYEIDESVASTDGTILSIVSVADGKDFFAFACGANVL